MGRVQINPGRKKRMLNRLAWLFLLSSAATLALFFASGWGSASLGCYNELQTNRAVYIEDGIAGYVVHGWGLVSDGFRIDADLCLAGGGWRSLENGVWPIQLSPYAGATTDIRIPLVTVASLLLAISVLLHYPSCRSEISSAAHARQGRRTSRMLRGIVLKWTMTSLAACFTIVLILSPWCVFFFVWSSPNDGAVFVRAKHGALSADFGWGDTGGSATRLAIGVGYSGSASPRFDDLFRLGNLNVTGLDGFIVPLLVPAGVTTLAAMLFWRADRRIRRGHCRICGYDLTANTSGRCPECGVRIPPGVSAAFSPADAADAAA